MTTITDEELLEQVTRFAGLKRYPQWEPRARAELARVIGVHARTVPDAERFVGELVDHFSECPAPAQIHAYVADRKGNEAKAEAGMPVFRCQQCRDVGGTQDADGRWSACSCNYGRRRFDERWMNLSEREQYAEDGLDVLVEIYDWQQRNQDLIAKRAKRKRGSAGLEPIGSVIATARVLNAMSRTESSQPC